MKKPLFIALCSLGLLAVSGISSCNKKSCEGIFCGSNRQCFEGECYCADGLEGDSCNQYANQKYIGSYMVYEADCGGGQGVPGGSPYQTEIQEYPGYANRLSITNFLNIANIVATISTDKANRGNIIEIPKQNYGGIQVSGVGAYIPSINNTRGRISINIEYTYSGVGYRCKHEFYPQ